MDLNGVALVAGAGKYPTIVPNKLYNQPISISELTS